MRIDIQNIRQTVIPRLATLALCLALGGMVGCEKGNQPNSKGSPIDETTTNPIEEEIDPLEKCQSGTEVLNRMFAAYHKASSYSDTGSIHVQIKAGDTNLDQKMKFSLTMERPNKLSLNAYQANLVCDGKKLQAKIEGIPDQVLVMKSPPVLDFKLINIDKSLAMSISDFGKYPPPPQLFLLLLKEPQDFLLRGTDKPMLTNSGTIGNRKCYRVKLTWPDGDGVLWVDEKTYALRRMVFPTDGIRSQIASLGPVEQISLVADFVDAKFDAPLNADAFTFTPPAKAEEVKYFVPPHTAQLLSKKMPVFKFEDTEGKPVTPETLEGKVVVLDFWTPLVNECKQSLQNMDAIRKKYKDNPNVVFYSVSVDEPRVPNSDLVRALENLKVSLQILRDPDMSAKAFKMSGIPSAFIIDAKGIVQDFEDNPTDPKFPELLSAKLDKVIAGEDIFEEPIKAYLAQRETLKEYSKTMESMSSESSKPGVVVREERIPEVKTGERSDPAGFKLSSLWKCPDRVPGNVLVVQNAADPARLFVVEQSKSVAEIGLDGKLIALHKLNIEAEEFISALRTAVGADGKRYFVAFSQSRQRCHVLDEKWNMVANYPEDALKKPHGGIATVEIGDLDGDGKLKLYVGYWGVVGVQCATLNGKRLWANRSLSNVSSLAFSGPDAQGRRDLYCTNNGGPLVVLNAQGERRGEINIPNRPFYAIASADLLGNGQTLCCGRSFVDSGVSGFTPKGEELWTYALPHDMLRQPIELILAGKMTREGPGQWIFPGPDGSIHFVSAEGAPWDKFNYGEQLCGLATAEIDGRPVLVVASPKGLEAWKVE